MAEAGFRVRAVEAPQEDQGAPYRCPVPRHFRLGFENPRADVVEVGTPGGPFGILFWEACDDAAEEDDEGWEDFGQ